MAHAVTLTRQIERFIFQSILQNIGLSDGIVEQVAERGNRFGVSWRAVDGC